MLEPKLSKYPQKENRSRRKTAAPSNKRLEMLRNGRRKGKGSRRRRRSQTIFKVCHLPATKGHKKRNMFRNLRHRIIQGEKEAGEEVERQTDLQSSNHGTA
ncbi:hypothetical protein JTB14_009143 [Gonioctena quinquepunctata]|nr:hypothetical protein JTB14_009143 [Gonioctena quinquepunctata]